MALCSGIVAFFVDVMDGTQPTVQLKTDQTTSFRAKREEIVVGQRTQPRDRGPERHQRMQVGERLLAVLGGGGVGEGMHAVRVLREDVDGIVFGGGEVQFFLRSAQDGDSKTFGLFGK